MRQRPCLDLCLRNDLPSCSGGVKLIIILILKKCSIITAFAGYILHTFIFVHKDKSLHLSVV